MWGLSALFFPRGPQPVLAGPGRLVPPGSLLASGRDASPCGFLWTLLILKSWVSSRSRSELQAQPPPPPGAPHQAGQMGGPLRPAAQRGLGPAVSAFSSRRDSGRGWPRGGGHPRAPEPEGGFRRPRDTNPGTLLGTVTVMPHGWGLPLTQGPLGDGSPFPTWLGASERPAWRALS